MTTVCPLCGLAYEPGGEECRDHGCPLAWAGCRTVHCPRCGYAVPDERLSAAARWIRRLFGPGPPGDGTLADLQPGPVQHATLAPELIERIKAYKKILGDADPASIHEVID